MRDRHVVLLGDAILGGLRLPGRGGGGGEGKRGEDTATMCACALQRRRSPKLAALRMRPAGRARRARSAASTRERQSSLRRMLRTCMSTVRRLRNRSLGDLAVGAPTESRRSTSSSRRERPAPSASAAARTPSRAADRLAEPRDHLARGVGGERPRAELARDAVGAAEVLQRQRRARPRRRARRPRAARSARARTACRGRGAARRRGVSWSAAVVRVALQQRRLADRAGERGERVGVARRAMRCGSAPRRTRARPAVALAGEVRGRPAQPAIA